MERIVDIRKNAKNPRRTALPATLRHMTPMMARTAPLPSNQEKYGFEFKWDGMRAVCYGEKGTIHLESRNGIDVTYRYPELEPLARAIGGAPIVLDGEIVALNERGIPDFSVLQKRMHLSDPREIASSIRSVPVVYMIFDLLYHDGESLLRRPYRERREILDRLALQGDTWQTPPWHMRDGQAMLDAAIQAGLEGIVAKRLDSPYLPGVRTDAWLKIKGQLRQEFVICGYTPGKGTHKGRVGALLLGYYEPEKSGRRRRLHFAGKVGTGISSADRIALKRSLDARRRTLTPFDIGRPETDVVFSEPIAVAEIEFYEWTRDGRLRHPVFKGLRDDKDPGDVVREDRGGMRSEG